MCKYKILQIATFLPQVWLERPEHSTNPNNKVNKPTVCTIEKQKINVKNILLQ
jgi:hypothetical protein